MVNVLKRFRKFYAVLAVAVVLVPAMLYAAFGKQETHEIHWLLAHQPTSVFENATSVFKKDLEEQTHGALTVTILTPEDFGVVGRDMTRKEVAALMAEGKVQISSLRSSEFEQESPRLSVFELPFLFRSYDAIERFIQSPFAGEVLRETSEKTPVTALAFTFSGGLRNVAFLSPSMSLDNLVGATVVTGGGSTTRQTLAAAFAAKAISSLTESDKENFKNASAVDMTYTRVANDVDSTNIKSVVETGHGVLTTMIVADDAFYNALPSDEKVMLASAAAAAAKMERQDSKALAEKIREALIAKGVQVTTLTEQQKDIYERRSKNVYDGLLANFPAAFVQTLNDFNHQ